MLQENRCEGTEGLLRVGRRLHFWLLAGLLAAGCLTPAAAITVRLALPWLSTSKLGQHGAWPVGNEYWGLESGGFSLCVVATKETFALGEPITIWLVSKNVSGEDRSVAHTYMGALRTDIELTVIDANGDSVLVTPATQAQTTGARGGGRDEACPVGMARMESFDLAPIFQLQSGHSYYVTAKKKVSGPDGRWQAISGNALIRIAAPSGNQPATTNAGVAEPIPFYPNRSGIVMPPLRPPPSTNTMPSAPVQRAKAFSGSTEQRKNASAHSAGAGGSSDDGQNASLAITTPTSGDSPSPRRWASIIAIVLMGLVAAILLRASCRKRTAGNSTQQ